MDTRYNLLQCNADCTEGASVAAFQSCWMTALGHDRAFDGLQKRPCCLIAIHGSCSSLHDTARYPHPQSSRARPTSRWSRWGSSCFRYLHSVRYMSFVFFASTRVALQLRPIPERTPSPLYLTQICCLDFFPFLWPDTDSHPRLGPFSQSPLYSSTPSYPPYHPFPPSHPSLQDSGLQMRE
ncbi:hypothetical protein DFH06DRAFT_1174716 [Mycena polygramma]|nr:hypothetical protein DFH06DRAFT_1174716 [Mycena polygramma]